MKNKSLLLLFHPFKFFYNALKNIDSVVEEIDDTTQIIDEQTQIFKSHIATLNGENKWMCKMREKNNG